MKKLKVLVMVFAAMAFVCVTTACSSERKEKTEKSSAKKDSIRNGASVNNNNPNAPIAGHSDIELESFDKVMTYLEDNADDFFPQLEIAMQPINKMLQGQMPEDEAAINEFTEFAMNNEAYLEAIGALLAYEQQGVLTTDEQARVKEFSDLHARGLEDIGTLIAVSMMMQQEMQQQIPSVQ